MSSTKISLLALFPLLVWSATGIVSINRVDAQSRDSTTLPLAPAPVNTKGELTIEFKWKLRQVGGGEFKDLTVLDRSTTIVCPVVASSLETTSIISGATPEQVEANKQLGKAAQEAVGGIGSEALDQMNALDKKMKACRKAGGSDQVCGMQIMMAMQTDPKLQELMNQAPSKSQAKAEAAVEAAGSKIQPWFNEGCSGHMTVNDSRKLDDPTIAGEEPTIHTTGTQKIDTKDTLVTVETDLAKGTTRYMIVAPDASGFLQEAYYGEDPKKVSAAGMPESVLIVGPFAGPIQSGSHNYNFGGGTVSVAWTFRKS